jgi:predicted lipoprotein with Yx(FWY)xxD motif
MKEAHFEWPLSKCKLLLDFRSDFQSRRNVPANLKWSIQMKKRILFPAFFVLALIVSACGAATPAAATGPAVVDVGQNANLGSFLVDSKGMTLYLFTQDTPNTSTCYASCATAWPPLLTSGAPTAGAGVTASLLGTTKRTDGTTQVTYNGWPLYYWRNDKVAGDTTGENVQNVWFVVTPAGVKK